MTTSQSVKVFGWAFAMMAAFLLVSPQGNLRNGLSFAVADSVHRVDLASFGNGVYAAIRREPLGLAVNANSMIVVGSEAVLVVDAQFTREATLETLKAIRSVTTKPVRYVVNTHWHDDHLAGNQVYRDSFPEVQFVMHENTRADVVSLGGPNREGTRGGAPPLIARYDRLLASGLGADSLPVSNGERESLSSALRIIKQYLAEQSSFRLSVEGPSVKDRMTLDLGGRIVSVHWFGRGNTRGDLVVEVPRERIFAVGDLLVSPVPFAFNSHPAEWRSVLDSIAGRAPAVLIPGHGPVMRDAKYLRQVQAMLAEVEDQVRISRDRGDSLSTMLRTITLASTKQRVTSGDDWKGKLFEQFFRVPAIRAAARPVTPPRTTSDRR